MAATTSLAQDRGPSAAPALPPGVITVAQDVLARYVGRYRLTEEVEVIITLEDGRLFGALTGRPRHELFATSPTDFFANDVEAQVSFEPGPDGRPVRARVTIGGQESYAPRVADSQ
jgi:hypothetical protein